MVRKIKRKPINLLAHTPRVSSATKQPAVPSAPTLFRFSIIDTNSRALMEKAAEKLDATIRQRDQPIVDKIQQAATPEALLDLAGEANGLAEEPWFERVERYGRANVPLLAARLKEARLIPDVNKRDIATERLIAALRWQGEVGGEALRECFDALTDYGKTLACTALGLLRIQASADAIWQYYQQVHSNAETYFVGALWGLIDLGDKRASEALTDLLQRRRRFYELYGFLSLAGDERAAIPLLLRLPEAGEDEQEDIRMALAAIAHRIGRKALLATFNTPSATEKSRATRQTIAANLSSYSLETIREHFQLFYRGLRDEDVQTYLAEEVGN